MRFLLRPNKQLDPNSKRFWENQSEVKETLTTEHCNHLGHVDKMEDKNPFYPRLQCVSEFDNRLFTFLESCSALTNIAGMPSRLLVNDEKPWATDQKIIWKKQLKTMKEILPQWASEEDEKHKNEMVLLSLSQSNADPHNCKNRLNMLKLVTSCPKDTRIYGFPSASKRSFNTFNSNLPVLQPTSTMKPNMIDLVPCCSRASCIQGFASLTEVPATAWESETKTILMEPQKRQKQTVALTGQEHLCPCNKKNMLKLATSCPKETRIYGFPSAPQRTRSLDIVNLNTPVPLITSKVEPSMISFVPCCSRASHIQGFASLTQVPPTEWQSETRTFPMEPQERQVLTMVHTGQEQLPHCNRENMLKLVTCCPKETRIYGFPSVPKRSFNTFNSNMPDLQPTSMMKPNMIDFVPCCSHASCIQGFASLAEVPATAWKSETKTILMEPQERQKQTVGLTGQEHLRHCSRRKMLKLVTSCPKETRIYGFPSAPRRSLDTINLDIPAFQSTSTMEPNMINFVPCCSRASHIQGFASLTEVPATAWESETKTILMEPQERQKQTVALTGQEHLCPCNNKKMLTLVTSCPKDTRIYGFPSAPKRSFNTFNSNMPVLQPKSMMKPNMIDFVPCCSRASCIQGFASLTEVPATAWESETKTILMEPQERQKQTVGLTGQKHLRHCSRRKMLKLVTSCPKETRIYGFPSAPQRTRSLGLVSLDKYISLPTVVPNMISFVPCCSHASRIRGFASLTEVPSTEWQSETRTFSIEPQERQILATALTGQEQLCHCDRENMLKLVTCCPKKTRIYGFLSAQKRSLDTLNSDIPALQPISTMKPNMIDFVPCCSRASHIRGFASLAEVPPTAWESETKTILMEPQERQKQTVALTGQKHLCPCNKKNMLKLVTSCPKETRIYGFPSAPERTRSLYMVSLDTPVPIPTFKVEPNIISFVPCCSRASCIRGFTSLAEVPTTEWQSERKAFLMKRQERQILATALAVHEQVICCNGKEMLKLVTSCPKETRIYGFPSAPERTRSLDMVNLDTPVPIPTFKVEPNIISFVPCCSRASCIRGFASLAEVPTTEWQSERKAFLMKRQERQILATALAVHEQVICCNGKEMLKLVTSCPKETRIYGFPSAPERTRSLDMVNLHPSIPHVSCVPGFPSTKSSECKPTKNPHKVLFEKRLNEKVFLAKFPAKQYKQNEIKKMVAMASSCPRLSQIHGFPSVLPVNTIEEKTRLILVPSSTEKSKLQELPNAQTSACSPVTKHAYEDKGGTKQSIDVYLDNGKSQIEKIAAEKAVTLKKCLDSTDTAGVFGWEVLETEGTVTENETEYSLSAKETSGLVKAIVGVFHKG
ncbi:uncharacterized protein LOC121639860 isoform X2 [Melanotaenia boesemani]|nr:uncharacterized protein LOC121639860 isoform X2 [Melanotaenia boesemani]